MENRARYALIGEPPVFVATSGSEVRAKLRE
jgi:hypothetical protein